MTEKIPEYKTTILTGDKPKMTKEQFDCIIQGFIDDGYEYEYIAKRLERSSWKNMKNSPRIEDEIYNAVLVEMFNLNGADISFDAENKFNVDAGKDDIFDEAITKVEKNFNLNKNSPVIPNKSGWHRWLERKDIKSKEARLKYIAGLGDKKMEQKTPELLALLEKEGVHVAPSDLVEFIQKQKLPILLGKEGFDVAPGDLVEFTQKLLILLEKEGFNVNSSNLVEFIQSEEGRMFFNDLKNN